MNVTLNIGLWINGEENANYGPRTVIADVMDIFRPEQISATRRFAKSGEPTMVVSMEVENSREIEPCIFELCRLLQQDCIAGKVDGSGFLIGPNTEPYGGEFNPDYFIAY